MRVFIGIKLNRPSQIKIEEFIKPIKKNSFPLKWVPSSNLHLTLKFIGDTRLEKLNQIISTVENLKFPGDNLEITFRGMKKFGNKDQINVIWIGIEENNSLIKLYEKIELSLFNHGFNRETRLFKPHLTVARNKQSYNYKSLISTIEKNQHILIHKMKVKTFQIFKSTLTPDGSIYSIIKEIPL